MPKYTPPKANTYRFSVGFGVTSLFLFPFAPVSAYALMVIAYALLVAGVKARGF